MESIDTLPPEKIAFIAYIGVYESVQKFGRLITSGKISDFELVRGETRCVVYWDPGM
jgi:hypothetical protein